MTTYDDFDLLHGLDRLFHWVDHLELPQYLQQTWLIAACLGLYFDVYFEGAYYFMERRFLDDINFIIDLCFYFDHFKGTGNYTTATAFRLQFTWLLRCLEGTLVTYLFTCFAAMLLMLQKLRWSTTSSSSTYSSCCTVRPLGLIG